MVKRLLALLLAALPAWAQFTTVTGTVHDVNNCPYIGGSGRAVISPGNTSFFLNGSTFQTVVVITTLDAHGQFSVTLADNSQVQPAGSQWQFSFCNQGATVCFKGPLLTISGSSVDITSSITPLSGILGCTTTSGPNFSAPVEFTVTGSGTNNIVLGKAVELPNTFWAGPTSGPDDGNARRMTPPPFMGMGMGGPIMAFPAYLFQSGAAQPTFRLIVAADLPFALPLGVANGGVGAASLTAHSVLVGEGIATVGQVTGSTHQVLHSVTSADPAFSAVSLTADVSGTLPAASGGTAVTDFAFGGSTHTAASQSGAYTTGHGIKIDASGNLIDSGSSSAAVIQSATTSTVCTTSTSAYATCDTALTWPTTFADTSYQVVCSGISPSGTTNGAIKLNVLTTSTSTVTVVISNGSSSGAQALTFSSVNCIGIHP